MPVGPRPPIPPLHAKLTLSGSSQGHAWRSIMYLAVAGSGITATDLSTLCDSIKAAWDTNIKPLLTSATGLTGVELVYIPSVGAETVGLGTYSSFGARAGTIVADASACYVIRWSIGAYYRGGHPRTYMAGPLIAYIANGSDVSSAEASNLATSWAAFRAAVNGLTTTHVTSITLGTLSFVRSDAWRTPPVFYPFGAASVNPKLGSQRRRIHT